MTFELQPAPFRSLSQHHVTEGMCDQEDRVPSFPKSELGVQCHSASSPILQKHFSGQGWLRTGTPSMTQLPLTGQTGLYLRHNKPEILDLYFPQLSDRAQALHQEGQARMNQGVTVRELDCCPQPQHLCSGRGSALGSRGK